MKFNEMLAVVGLANQNNRLVAGHQVEIDEQFKAIRGLLVTIIILLGLITGILLALAWEYL